jgi:hypothetical protein
MLNACLTTATVEYHHRSVAAYGRAQTAVTDADQFARNWHTPSLRLTLRISGAAKWRAFCASQNA